MGTPILIVILAILASLLVATARLFHLAAYNVNIGQTVDTDTPAIADDILIIQNNHFLPQNDMDLLWMYASSATLLRAKLSTPKTRVISDLLVRPINVATLPASNTNMDMRFQNPYHLNHLEEIKMLLTSGLAMGNEQAFGVVALGIPPYTPSAVGDVYRLRWTSTTTATVRGWTTLAITFDVQLPYGSYSVIGGEAQSTNIIAFRTIFDNQYWRPGNLGISSLANRLPYRLVDGALGEWGQFHTTNLPRIQVLCNAADNSFEGYINCLRIG